MKLIPLRNTVLTYISPGYSNHLLLTRRDYPIEKKKHLFSFLMYCVYKCVWGEYKHGVGRQPER